MPKLKRNQKKESEAMTDIEIAPASEVIRWKTTKPR